MGWAVTEYEHIEMPYGMVPEPDVVDTLVAQHMQIRDLMVEVLTGDADHRAEPLAHLVALLSVHETAEEEVVHPVARQLEAGESAVVDDRVNEEHDAKQLLGQLDGMDPHDEQFMPLFTKLRSSVLTHAIAEQRYEFNHIRHKTPAGQRASMSTIVQAAQKVAPTHPHPGMESAKKNMLLGPAAAIVDRARDAIADARNT